MSLENLLNHTCDIYHIREKAESPGYGLAPSPAFSYPDGPDIRGQRCHFGVKSQSVTVTQTAPANLMEARTKLTLPIGADVRLNDKIIDCATGQEYTAEQPVSVRNHHLFVFIKKVGEERHL